MHGFKDEKEGSNNNFLKVNIMSVSIYVIQPGWGYVGDKDFLKNFIMYVFPWTR